MSCIQIIMSLVKCKSIHILYPSVTFMYSRELRLNAWKLGFNFFRREDIVLDRVKISRLIEVNHIRPTLTMLTMVSIVTRRTLTIVAGSLVVTLSTILARLASTRVHIWKNEFTVEHLKRITAGGKHYETTIGLTDLLDPMRGPLDWLIAGPTDLWPNNASRIMFVHLPWSQSAPLQSDKHTQSFPTLQTPLSVKIVM